MVIRLRDLETDLIGSQTSVLGNYYLPIISDEEVIRQKDYLVARINMILDGEHDEPTSSLLNDVTDANSSRLILISVMRDYNLSEFDFTNPVSVRATIIPGFVSSLRQRHCGVCNSYYLFLAGTPPNHQCVPSSFRCCFCDTRYTNEYLHTQIYVNSSDITYPVCNNPNCISRIRTCDLCNSETIHTSGASSLRTGRFCQNCIFHCARCGDTDLQTNAFSHRNRDYCENCHANVSVILGHEFDPLSVLSFIGKPSDNLYFGVELEVETPGNKIEAARSVSQALKDFAIIKHDGSLDNGFEIVTAPASFEAQAEGWEKFFNMENAPTLTSWESPRCGMHVHFSRNAVSPNHLARIMVFVYSPSNRNMIELVAGRILSDGWGARYAEINTTRKITDVVGIYSDLPKELFRRVPYTRENGETSYRSITLAPSNVSLSGKGKKIVKLNNFGNRYTALNDVNPNTVEMRIFRGTTKKSGLLKNIEFVHAAVKFCTPGSHAFSEIEAPEAFLKFVANNKKQYRNLNNFFIKFQSTLNRPRTNANPRLTTNTTAASRFSVFGANS